MTTQQFHTSATEARQFRTCRRQWYLQTQEHLQRKAPQWALIFGTAVHSGLDAYYKGYAKTGVRDVQKALRGFSKEWAVSDAMLQEDFAEVYDMGISKEWWEMKELGIAMLRNYDAYDKVTKSFDTIHEIAVEDRAWAKVQFDGNPILYNAMSALLSGRMDLVVSKGKDIWIWDHKTAKQKPSDTNIDLDDQGTAYCYLYWRMTGVMARGFVYNTLIKRVPSEVTILSSTGLPSTNVKQYVTKAAYVKALNTCKVKDLDGTPSKQSNTTYREMLESLDNRGWSDYFMRSYSPRSKQQLLNFEARFAIQAEDMFRVLKDPLQAYPSPSTNCAGCGMRDLCLAMECGDDVDYMRETSYRVLPPRVVIPKSLKED